jgi:hypothetical protein
MKKTVSSILFILCSCSLWAQATFKAGWNTYQTAILTHEYTYNIMGNDSTKLYLTDSLVQFASKDSLVVLVLRFPLRDKSLYKTCSYLNTKKQVIKWEQYRDDNLEILKEWRYDDKNRKIYYLEDDKLTGNLYKKNYEYATDKKSGELVVIESSYYNGRIEFYTKSFYNKASVKIKEIRLNDNNKDVVHIESYVYGENGKVKERTVYFPEWKVTRKFEEKEGCQTPKCFKMLPVGTNEKISLNTRVAAIKKLIARNQVLLNDKDCHEYEYKFTNYANCDIVVATTGVNNGKKVTFRYKERL